MSATIEPLINAERVTAIIGECLGEDDGEDRIIVDGIIHTYAFRADQLEAHRDEIGKMLKNLPTQFRGTDVGGGGGWSFLNACQDANDVQWTGLHWVMEQLLCLGIALGLAEWIGPREMWSAFPGGMPYVMVTV